MVKEEKEVRLETLGGELQSLSTSLAAQKGAKAGPEAKVVAWGGQGGRVARHGGGGGGAGGFGRRQLREGEGEGEAGDDNISRLQWGVRRMEDIVAKEAWVKEEVVDKVVEVEVEETEEDEVEEKVVEEKTVGAEQWLFWGAREAGSIQDVPWDPAVLAGPHPPNLDQPLLFPRRV